jgi:hypothetical protein
MFPVSRDIELLSLANDLFGPIGKRRNDAPNHLQELLSLHAFSTEHYVKWRSFNVASRSGLAYIHFADFRRDHSWYMCARHRFPHGITSLHAFRPSKLDEEWPPSQLGSERLGRTTFVLAFSRLSRHATDAARPVAPSVARRRVTHADKPTGLCRHPFKHSERSNYTGNGTPLFPCAGD